MNSVLSSNMPEVKHPVSLGSSTTYLKRCASITTETSLVDPLALSFLEERLNAQPANAPPTTIRDLQAEADLDRLRAKLSTGAVIAESHDFAAIACWTPPGSTSPLTDQELANIAQDRPVFANFLTQIEAAKREHLFSKHGNRYWHLSMMIRDSRRAYIPGAVRAVVDPFLHKAREDNVAVWLEAGNARARDIYLHFGFRVVSTITVQDHEAWCMMIDPVQ